MTGRRVTERKWQKEDMKTLTHVPRMFGNAPSSATAPFQGLLFFQDPRATSTHDNKFNGGSTMNLTGGIYFPSEQVEWTGNNSSGTPTCTKIVAKTIVFTGNSNMDDSGCAAAGVNPIQIQGVALVD